MKEQSVRQEFFRYVLFNILGMLGLSFYILADTFFIANGIGAKGLAALNIAIPVYSLVHGTGLMLAMGGGTRYNILRSQEHKREADIIFTNIIWLVMLFAFLFAAAGLFFPGQIAKLLGADSDIFCMTRVYIQVILLFSPAFLLNDVFVCFVRNDGNPRLSTAGMLLGSLFNILFDYIFIYPMQMGIFGAVLATGFAPMVSMLVLSRHWLSKKNQFHLVLTRLYGKNVLRIFAIGFPSFVTELSSGIVMIVFNLIILKLNGNIGVAAYGIIANLSLVVLAIFTGIAHGAQPLISRFFGRKQPDMEKEVLSYAVCLMAGISIFIYGMLFFFAEPITDMFNSEGNQTLLEIAVRGLRIYFTGILFAGFNIIFSVYFTAREQAWPSQMISLLRGFALIIPITFLLSAFWGLCGVWLAFPVTEGLVAFFAGILYDRIQKKTHADCDI